MTFDAAGLEALVQEGAWAALLVFLRVGAIVSLVPAFGEQSIPVRVRLAVALAFALIVLPAIGPGIGAAPEGPAGILLACLAEVLAGLIFGLMLRFFVFVLMIAGMIAAQSTSLSQLFGNSAGGEPSPAASHLLVSGGLAVAAALGLHVRVAEYMIGSYLLIAPGSLPSAEAVVTAGLAEVGRATSLAFTLAAPFMMAALLYNVTLGIINRAMPQLMVTFVGAPAITFGGLVLLAIAAPVMLSLWSSALFSFMSAPFGPLP
jgi:flagellar biosynthetic protein FliR